MSSVAGGLAFQALSRRLPRRLLVAAFVPLVAFRVVVLLIGLQQGHMVDRYYELGHDAGRPYADYAVEYPPVLLAVVKLLAFATPNVHAFTAAIIAISLVAEAAVAVMLWREWSAESALWYLCVDTLVVALFMMRLDLLSVAIVVAALVAAMHSRPSLAALCMVIAIGLRLWPAPLALAVLPLLPSGARRRYVTVGLAGLAVLLAAWLSLGGVAGVQQVTSFRGATGWQIESVVGSIVRIFSGGPVSMQQGAFRFGHVPAALSVLMPLCAFALWVWVLVHVKSRRDLGVAWVACAGGLLAVSTLFSPQYVAWLIPAGAIAWVWGDVLVATLVAGVALGTALEFGVYNEVVAGWTQGIAFLLARNALLIAAVVGSVTVLTRDRTRRPNASRPGTVPRSPVATGTV